MFFIHRHAALSSSVASNVYHVYKQGQGTKSRDIVSCRDSVVGGIYLQSNCRILYITDATDSDVAPARSEDCGGLISNYGWNSPDPIS